MDIPEEEYMRTGEGEEDDFDKKIRELKETFVEQVRIACAESGRDFKETLKASLEDMPEIAIRSRKYTPTKWTMALRLAGKEMPVELREGRKNLRGQYALYARDRIYNDPERQDELDQMLADEVNELKGNFEIRTDSIKRATTKALKHLEKSVLCLRRV